MFFETMTIYNLLCYHVSTLIWKIAYTENKERLSGIWDVFKLND